MASVARCVQCRSTSHNSRCLPASVRNSLSTNEHANVVDVVEFAHQMVTNVTTIIAWHTNHKTYMTIK
eukprot:3066726-Amphidinium_carterae.1